MMSEGIKKCKCGCGEEIPASDARGNPKTYIRYHHNKDQHRNTIQDILLRLVLCEPNRLPTGCWEFSGAKTDYGYGNVILNGKNRRVHIVVYEHFVGQVPKGYHLHHKCENPSCSNYEHLVPLTPREHQLVSKNIAVLNAAKTHCPKGHEYSRENTYRWKNCRQCITCRNDYKRQLRHKDEASR